MTTATKANQAIARSVSRNEIVTVDYDASVASELVAESENHVQGNDVTEFWGITPTGDEWRVHMRGAA